ncbi:MAG: SGNH/GDSL hydrolase family protein [Nitrospira sp.]|nr:SGNH/GDSL hydrolase family protein [Nitrospira sp.]
MTKYSTKPGGIYYFDPVLRMNFMLPSYSAEMAYNGYHWHHQTDQYGFRNHEGRTKADILLLGDSHTYGHGLEMEQTVGYFLERLAGRTVYSLGRQGDSSFQEAYLLTEQIARLQPRVVLYFFCENDIRDVYAYQTDSQLQEFIETPVNDITYPLRMDVLSAIKRRDEENAQIMHPSSLLDVIRQRSYLVKVYDWNQFIRKEQAFEVRISDQNHDENNGTSLGWKYTKKAIAYMNYVAAQHGAKFIIVPIPAMNKRLMAILKEVADEQALPVVDTASLDPSDPSNAVFFLPRDGHLSEKGANAMAALISEQLGKKRSLLSPTVFN